MRPMFGVGAGLIIDFPSMSELLDRVLYRYRLTNLFQRIISGRYNCLFDGFGQIAAPVAKSQRQFVPVSPSMVSAFNRYDL